MHATRLQAMGRGTGLGALLGSILGLVVAVADGALLRAPLLAGTGLLLGGIWGAVLGLASRWVIAAGRKDLLRIGDPRNNGGDAFHRGRGEHG